MQNEIKICKTDILQPTKMWNQKKLKICLTDFLKNFDTMRFTHKINRENFIRGSTVGFWAILDERRAFTTLDKNWTSYVLYLCMHWCDAMHCVRERKSEFRLFYRLFRPFLSYFIGPRLKDMFESGLKLSLRKPKWINAFKFLKLFSFFLRGYMRSFFTYV